MPTKPSDKKGDGCEIHPTCTECSEPECLLFEPRGIRRYKKEKRNKEICKLSNEGKTVEELAITFNLHRRTIEKVLKK